MKDIFIFKIDISIAEPIEVQIDELGNSTIQMCHVIGIINDGKSRWSRTIFK